MIKERKSVQDENRVKERLTFQPLPTNWKLHNICEYCKLIQQGRVRLINMEKAYKSVFHDNQTYIEKLLTNESINKKENGIENIFLDVNSKQFAYNDSVYYTAKEKEYVEEENHDCATADSKFDIIPLSRLYFLSIYNLLHKMEHRYLNDHNKIRGYFSFDYSNNLTPSILRKFTKIRKLLVKFLPPLIVRAPEEDYLSPQPHFTIKSNSVCIVKTGI